MGGRFCEQKKFIVEQQTDNEAALETQGYL